MNPPDIRINARLTGDDATRFRELLASEGVSASELLRAALRDYHRSRSRPAVDVLAVLDRNGYLASGDGPEDLSDRYKSHLAEALEDKHPLRVHEQ